MTSPISLFLPTFTPTPPVEPDAEEAPGLTMPEAGFVEDVFESPAEDLRSRIAEARQQSLAEAAAETQAALDAQAAELRAQHAEALAEERRHWAEKQAGVLAAELKAGLAEIERTLAEGVVEVLQPFLDRSVRAKAAEELRQAVGDLLAGGEGAVLRIHGPADLVEPLRTAGAGQASIEATVADTPEVTLECGDTTIRTRLRSWAASFEAQVEAVR